MTDDDTLLQPRELERLTGNEALGPGRVIDFWRWALGDLRMNNTRGHLAEYLVARAVDDTRHGRIEWDAYDVVAADGTRIEVKATGRLQSWASRKPSPVSWKFPNVAAHEVWSHDEAAYVPVDPAERLDVWVFALHTATDPEAYAPLDLTQWEFRVLPHRTLLATGQKSAALSTIERLGGHPVPAQDLAAAVTAARAENDATEPSTTPDPPRR